MDLWIAAAADCVGHLSKNFNNAMSSHKGGVLKPVSVDSIDEKCEVVKTMGKQVEQKAAESGSSFFQRVISRQAEATDGLSSDLGDRHLNTRPEEMTSGSRSTIDIPMGSEEYVSDSSSILSLHPWIFRKDNYQAVKERMMGDYLIFDKCGYDYDNDSKCLQRPNLTRNAALGCHFGRNKTSIQNRHTYRHSIKPFNPIQNCLIPQLYGNDFEIEEFVFSPAESQSSSFRRTLCVTNGSQIINKSYAGPDDTCNGAVTHSEINGAHPTKSVIEVKPLLESRQSKRKSEDMRQGGLREFNSKQCCKLVSSRGSHDGLLLFCIGLGIGIISTLIKSKKEVDHLHDMLKQRENLVQDLQEELELKDSLTVNDYTIKAFEIEETNHSCTCSQEPDNFLKVQEGMLHTSSLEKNIFNQSCFNKSGEKTEAISKIEAELEAELELLELNMSASSLEGKLSALHEVDPNYTADVVCGELREDVLNSRRELLIESKESSKSSSTEFTNPVNYSVSPRELTIRLHEVNQTRLEERVRELETELYNCRKQLQLREDEMAHPLNSTGERGSPLKRGSPNTVKHTQPLCLNLSGDALEAYNEAYEEFSGINEDDEKPIFSINSIDQINEDDLFESDGSLLRCIDDLQLDASWQNSNYLDRNSTWKHNLNKEDNKGGCTNEEDDDIDEEEGRMLIQQIVERTKQGSSILLNAQRIFSMDK